MDALGTTKGPGTTWVPGSFRLGAAAAAGGRRSAQRTMRPWAWEVAAARRSETSCQLAMFQMALT